MTFYDIAEEVDWLKMIPGGFVCKNGLIAYPDEKNYHLRSEIYAEMVKVKRARFHDSQDIEVFTLLLNCFRSAGGYAAIATNYASHSYPSTYAYFYLWHREPTQAAHQQASKKPDIALALAA